ncbi:hypothetical protein [Spiroplasma endosymbiont of 'Nebria riversi']|uniref:hypothetical protein n=1 Tax=Spiroplasma endosymbiont of 'Nebria riversi' TaxID=2792084 RepID=UPI001C045FB3|nr:hypothetical protein [Spiroplasma endosymbiont of 'Nebria riversi']
MRNILKYLITMLSTAIPVLSVVTCSKNNDDTSESSEEKVIVDPIVQAKNLINEEILDKHREKIYTANSLGLNDSQIRSTMTPLVSQAQDGNSAVHLENNEKISEQILRILQNDLIGSINRKLRDKMIYFANISNPTSFTRDKSRFIVTKVSFDQMIRVLGDLKNRQSDNLNSQSDDSNNYYVYKLQLSIELDLVLKQGQTTHNIYLDIYLTQDKTAFANKISELTALVREHIKANVTFDLEKLKFQALSETNIKKQILNQINSNNEEKLSISNTGLKRNLLINSLNSTTNSKEYLEFLKISDGVGINTKISDFITKDKEFQKYNSDFVSAPDNKEIFLGSFDFTFWNSTYFELPLQRIELKDNRITVSKGAFATQLLNISEVLRYYFSKVFSEKSKFRGNNRDSVYLIVPLPVWKKYMSLTNGADEIKVFNIGKKMYKIFQDTIEEHNKKLLQERGFEGSIFISLTDKTKILVTWNAKQAIGAYRGYSGLSSVSAQLEVGFFTLNIIKNADFWYGLAI